MKIKVLLVDDHKILRDGLRALISTDPELTIVGECEDGDCAKSFVENNEVDVVLMDIKMPNTNGIEATKYISEHFPDIKVLVLSMHSDEKYITEMIESGANGYVLKNTEADELIFAIKKVYEGECYYSSEVTSVIAANVVRNMSSNSRQEKVTSDDLTKREKEIIILIAEEFTNHEIADKLFLSPRTIDTHRRNLLQKLGAKNTAGLVKFAIKNELV